MTAPLSGVIPIEYEFYMQLPHTGEDDFSIGMIDNISITTLFFDNIYSKYSINVNNLIKESLLKQNLMFKSPVVYYFWPV